MPGYIANQRVGAAVYNLFHTYSTPLLICAVLWLSGKSSGTWLMLIWLARIGFDRIPGFGLKYATAFRDTHLNRV